MLHSFFSSPEVRDWQWELASRMRSAMLGVYATRADERACVRGIIDAIQGMGGIGSTRHRDARLSIEAAYLDGPRSQVRFDLGGGSKQCELADILVLASFVDRGVLIGQRACFIQAKREASRPVKTSPAKYEIDHTQLSLLQMFPEFDGVSGLFAGAHLRLRNGSGMLGAYGLLGAPGDLTIVSARLLSLVLGGRRGLPVRDLVPAVVAERSGMQYDASSRGGLLHPHHIIDPRHCPLCEEMFHMFGPFHHVHSWPPDPAHCSRCQRAYEHFVGMGGGIDETSVTSCMTADEFVTAWTSLRLGEPWRTSASSATDTALRRAVDRAVERVAAASGGLCELRRTLAQRVNDMPPPPDDRISRSESGDGGGLAIISAVTETRQG